MLHDEQQIEENGEQTKAQFRRRAEDRRPIVVVDRQEEHLQDAQNATGKVE